MSELPAEQTGEPAAAEPAAPETITVPAAELNALRRRVAEGEKAGRHAREVAEQATRDVTP